MNYEMILTEIRNRVGLITLNRPQAMNALNNQLMGEVMDALESFDRHEDIGAMVITGNEKAFAAGADIKEMADKSAYRNDGQRPRSRLWQDPTIRKPVIAAVSGWALGADAKSPCRVT